MKYGFVVLALLGAAAGAFMYLGTSSTTVQQIQQQVAVLRVGEAPPIRQLAPDTLFSYTEARDLATHWDRLAQSASWADVEESNVLNVIARQPRVRAFLDTVMDVSEKIDFDVTDENVMKFVGKECGLGLALNPDGGEPDILLLTRLDVAGLAQDMTRNTTLTSADWKVLQEELNKRTGQVQFNVTTATEGDYDLATCVREDVTLYSTLIEDVLVFSTSESLARAALAARTSDGAGTLSTLPAFTEEMAALGGDSPLAGWVHISLLQSERTLLEKNCSAIDASAAQTPVDEETPDLPAEHYVPSYLVLSDILDAVEGAPALAWATRIPQGDLYALDWDLSRTSEQLFVDKLDVTPSHAVPPGGVAYMETHDLAGLVAAWDRSAAKRHLMASDLVKKAEEMIGAEETVRALSEGRPPAVLGVGGGPDLDLDPGGGDEPSLRGRFLPRFGWNVMSKQIGTLVGDSMAASLHWDPAQNEIPILTYAMDLGVAGRLAMVASMAYERHRGEKGTRFVEHGGRWLMLRDEYDQTLCVSLVGDAVIAASSDAAARTAIDRSMQPAEGGAVAAHAAAERLGIPSGQRMLLHIDGVRLRTALERLGNTGNVGSDEMEMVKKIFSFEHYMLAVDVDDAFTRIDVHYGASMDSETNNAIRELLTGMPTGSPASWALLTDRPFYVATNNLELSLYYNMIRDWVPDGARSEMDDSMAEIDEALEMRLIQDVLPAFGPEITAAATYHAAPEPPPGAAPGSAPPAIPGFVFMLQVRDYDVVKRFIDRLVDLGNESSRDRFQGRPGWEGGPAPDILVHTPHNGVDIVTLALTEEERAEVPIEMSPALAVVGEFVVLSLHTEDVHRAIDLASGAGTSFVASDIVRRAASDGVDIAGSSAVLVDWNTLMDQVAEYDTMIAGIIPGTEEPEFPEYPDDGDPEEWQRRVDKYQAASLAAREKAAEQVGGYLDSFRIIQYMASTSRMEGDVASARTMIRFIE